MVVVRPRGAAGVGGLGNVGLLLARAKNEDEEAAIGHQTGGRVGFFLHTEDFARDHARMTAAGVKFLEEPRHEPYGSVAVFEDLYGNRWDLSSRPTRARRPRGPGRARRARRPLVAAPPSPPQSSPFVSRGQTATAISTAAHTASGVTGQ